MIYSFTCSALSVALEQLQKIIKEREEKKERTVIFCEDRLTLAAERAVCSAVGGTFLTSVYTLARFLSSKTPKTSNVLSSQGSAMAVRKIIEDNKDKLVLFKKLSSANAAQNVYDTIALLYSSRVSPSDAEKAAERGGILGGKLKDLAVIYAEYERYLKESGKTDRNAYLRQLPEVISSSPEIKQASVIFLGFQAFTCTSGECVRAAFGAAQNVYGLFIGGNEEIYVNEACAFFDGAAKEFGGAAKKTLSHDFNDEAAHLRKNLFNPESYFGEKMTAERTHVFEAADGEQELEFIASRIKKHVREEERYAKISVMLPDLDKSERALSRVFARYKIPYYADRQISLSEHSLCAFIVNVLSCVAYGCRYADADAVIASPFFPAERREKDVFRNYLMRLANFRGGIKKEPKAEVLLSLGFDEQTVKKTRETFLEGLSLFSAKGGKSGICGGLHALFGKFNVKEKLEELSAKFKDELPSAAQFSARVLDGALAVIDEADGITPDDTPLPEFIKIIKSGFAAMKISLIPPKADAVFVGDLAATANTGSNVVFAAGLSGDVPSSSSDDSLLTDREITALESVNLNISPKIRQVNARKRETCALNICAFRKELYLTYSSDGESGASEIISYANKIFNTRSGAELSPVSISEFEKSSVQAPYYCSEKRTAVRYLAKFPYSVQASSVREVLKRKGYASEAYGVLEKPEKKDISGGLRLYAGGNNSIAPTTLETYFLCPYMNFVTRGLRAKERVRGAVRPTDTGNFIHAVLQDLINEKIDFENVGEVEERARQIAEEKIKIAPYSALYDSKSGKYVSGELIEEAVSVSKGMYEQLVNSSFTASGAESRCQVTLDCGIKVSGKIDRIDVSACAESKSDDMVRVIDYKSGTIDATSGKYYSGTKLQLQLYLLSASKGKRAVGAYYFPASVTYKDEDDGVFRLQGFMDRSDDVIIASDSTVQTGKKSRYVNVSYHGKGKISENAMTREDFNDFLEYSLLVSDGAAREMCGGNISPSPTKGACEFCKVGGSCGVTIGMGVEERKVPSVKCSEIADITRKVKVKEEENNDSHF